MTTYVRRGLRIETAVAQGPAAQDVVVDMRKQHYQAVLDTLGIEPWDGYDGDATHFVYFCGGVPVACLRSAADTAATGEAADHFSCLAAQLPSGTDKYVYLSRLLVTPGFRGIGLTAVIAYTMATWWTSNSPLEFFLAGSTQLSAGSARNLGAKTLGGPIYLGPERTPVQLVGGSLSGLAGRAKALLDRIGWLAEA